MKSTFVFFIIIIHCSCKTQKCELSDVFEKKLYEYDLSSSLAYKITEDTRLKLVLKKYCAEINNTDSFLVLLAATSTSSEYSGLIFLAQQGKIINYYAKGDENAVQTGDHKKTHILAALLDTVKIDIKQGLEKYADYADSRRISEGLIINCLYVKKEEGVVLRRAFSYPW